MVVTLSHPPYRPDIDGLRALAVLSVVAFHAFPDWLPGGFIGVDVFFVISGYLISTILFTNLHQGTFSLSEFYARRIRRIFPALILVLITTYILGWFLLLADEYRQLATHMAGGAGFLSNFMLWREAGYFDDASETKPLLHLWSLGIEEQFYLLYPVLLWLAWTHRFSLLGITSCLTLVSLSLNVTEVHRDSIAAFYAPHTRFWELLCGGVLAWLHLYQPDWFPGLARETDGPQSMTVHPSLPSLFETRLCHGSSFIGLFLLLYGCLFFTKDLIYPGLWAVIPVAGSVLILGWGKPSWINATILSSRLAVWFGLISFPLYLWHWVGLSFLRIVWGGPPDLFARLGAVMVSILFAWLTYRCVEQFFRRDGQTRRKVAALALVMLAVCLVGLGTRWMDGVPERTIAQANTAVSRGPDAGDLEFMSPGCGIAEPSVASLFAYCAQDRRGHVRFALLGDSKAGALYPGLVRTSDRAGRWLFIGGNGAHGAPVPMLATRDARRRHDETLTKVAVQAIQDNPTIDTVVIVSAIRAIYGLHDGGTQGHASTYDHTYLNQLDSVEDDGETLRAVQNVVDPLVGAGKRVVFVVDNPPLPDPKDCLNRRPSLMQADPFLPDPHRVCEIPLATFTKQIARYRMLLDELRYRYPSHVDVFDPTEVLCEIETGTCGMIRDGKFLYAFTDHISDYAAGLVGTKLNSFVNRMTVARSP